MFTPKVDPRESVLENGFFLVLEGLDGCGKSTQHSLLKTSLASLPAGAHFFREPTARAAFEGWSREGARGTRPAPRAELDFFVEDRERHVRATLLPALRAGKFAVGDRYIVSNVCYQGALGIPPAEILAMNLRRELPWPDLTVVLDLEVGEALQRLEARRGASPLSLYEKKENLTKVKEILDSLSFLPGVRRVSAKRSPSEIHREIWDLAAEAVASKEKAFYRHRPQPARPEERPSAFFREGGEKRARERGERERGIFFSSF
ncbi:MAG: dTMP kinase [Deltaproteobacteria bacterium]|jgi:dTMP kinase|nr:dTMP kinase [Deltaproteobacteria bacterium]